MMSATTSAWPPAPQTTILGRILSGVVRGLPCSVSGQPSRLAWNQAAVLDDLQEPVDRAHPRLVTSGSMSIQRQSAPDVGVLNETVHMVSVRSRFETIDEHAVAVAGDDVAALRQVADDNRGTAQLDFSNHTGKWAEPHWHDEQ